METHVFRQQTELRALERQIGTAHESWSPLACGRNGIFANPALSGIAAERGRTVAQIALRFLVQQGIIVIPKSSSPERMRENLAVFDFELEPEEMAAIEGLNGGKSLFGWW